MDADLPAVERPALATDDLVRPTLTERLVAALEVLLCSDYPTQALLLLTLPTFGLHPTNGDNTLNLTFVVWLSLLDTALLIGVIVLFLRAHGERPREVFLGTRPVAGELRAGLPMTLVAFAIAVAVLVTLRLIAPSLHSVPENPLQDLVKSPMDALIFAIVAVIAGGVREELQRAFLMRRFERSLGGAKVGVVVASAMFGLGHFVQGNDAVVATAILGAFWAIVYLRRGSVVAPIVSHSGFNLLQLVQLAFTGR